MAPLPAAAIAALPPTRGYAFQAFVLSTLGAQLTAHQGWHWHHPGGLATFPTRAGGSFQASTGLYSYLQNGVADRALCQELTVLGVSGASHQLDIALVRLGVGGLGGPSVSHQLVGTVVEAKNLGVSASMGVARETVGLAADLDVGWNLPRTRRVALTLAHAATGNAVTMVESFGQSVLENAGPLAPTTWAPWLARRLRVA